MQIALHWVPTVNIGVEVPHIEILSRNKADTKSVRTTEDENFEN
jgi:hypothetical protein